MSKLSQCKCVYCKSLFGKPTPILRFVDHDESFKSLQVNHYFQPDICSGECFTKFLQQKKTQKDSKISTGYRSNKLYMSFHNRTKNCSLKCQWYWWERSVLGSAGMNQSISFKSSIERKFASWLLSKEIPFLYEPFAFTWHEGVKCMLYIPDFFIEPSNVFVEVKGLLNKDTWEKFEKFHSLLPNQAFLLTNKFLNKICQL